MSKAGALAFGITLGVAATSIMIIISDWGARGMSCGI
jgi:hypothetical protein